MEMVDLRLRLGSSSSGGGDDDEASTASCNNRMARLFESSGEYQQQRRRRQQITLLYDGRICVCDVTEIQARAIIAMAKREMDGHMKKKKTQAHRQPIESSLPPSPPPRPVERLLINPELSMKRSLQRFLQKRKSREHALSPYGHRPQHSYSIKP